METYLKEIETQILNILDTKSSVSNDFLCNSIEGQDAEIQKALNKLIASRKIAFFEIKGTAMWKKQSEIQAHRIKGLTLEESHCYDLIVSSGNLGLTENEVKEKTKISYTLAKKVLKRLESKKLLKNIKVANTKNKKIWLEANTTPSFEITGGVFCVDQEYNSDLIDAFKIKILNYVSDQKICGRKEVWLSVKSSGLTNQEVNEKDIQNILNLLIIEGQIEVADPPCEGTSLYSLLVGSDSKELNLLRYRIVKEYKPEMPLRELPCYHCPVAQECGEGNYINPTDCPHMQAYLDF